MEPIKTIGKLLEGETRRDAVHIAIAPVVAAEPLKPGDRVGLDGYGKASHSEEHIGIVDPFLSVSCVDIGDQFWLLLFPGTVESLRHEWEHPGFPKSITSYVDPVASEKWLREFADSEGESYEKILSMAANDGDYYYLSSGIDVPSEFWAHYLAVTGKRGDVRDYFFCSC